MKEESKQLKGFIENSKNILVTTHMGPDPDAISSTLLTIHTLRKLFNKENIDSIVQGDTKYGAENIEWDKEFKKIKRVRETDTVDLSKYDLIIVVDSNGIDRAFNNHYDLSPEAIVISIDHHELIKELIAKLTLSINDNLSSATQQLYLTFKDILGEDFTNDPYVSELTQIGIINDTNRFMYKGKNPLPFALMEELTNVYEMNIEEYTRVVNIKPLYSYKALGEVIKNFKHEGNMGYTYITKDFIDSNNLTIDDRNSGVTFFMDFYVRDLKGIDWIFILKESLEIPDEFSISFRAVNETKNVQEIAKILGGNGHISAAGAKVEAGNIEFAIQQVLKAIKDTED